MRRYVTKLEKHKCVAIEHNNLLPTNVRKRVRKNYKGRYIMRRYVTKLEKQKCVPPSSPSSSSKKQKRYNTAGVPKETRKKELRVGGGGGGGGGVGTGKVHNWALEEDVQKWEEEKKR